MSLSEQQLSKEKWTPWEPVAFTNIVDGKGVQCIQRTRLTLKDLDYLFKILMTKILMTKTNWGWYRKKI